MNDSESRRAERAARMAGDDAALRACAARARRVADLYPCESCEVECAVGADGRARCDTCRRSDERYALDHGISWRCTCGVLAEEGEPCDACGSVPVLDHCDLCGTPRTDEDPGHVFCRECAS